MLATATDALGLEPTFVVGGIVDAYHTNAVSGKGDYYVVEADESDGSFLNLSPYVALVTNVEADHLDHYTGGIEEIRATFLQFMQSVPEEGAVVVCGEDPKLVELAQEERPSHGCLWLRRGLRHAYFELPHAWRGLVVHALVRRWHNRRCRIEVQPWHP